MKRIILICIVAWSAFCCWCQNHRADSLVTVLETQELTSDEKLQLYWDILLCYWNNDLDTSIVYAKEAASLAEKLNDNLWSAKFNRGLGICLFRKSDYETSRKALQRAMEYAVKAGDKKEEINVYLQMGNLQMTAGDLMDALQYYSNALPELENLELHELYINTLGNIAAIHSQLYNDDKALDSFKQMMAMADKYNFIRPKMYAYSSIGNIYSKKGKWKDAIASVHKSYDISRELNDKNHIVISTQMLAGMYSELEIYDTASIYARECLQTAIELGAEQQIRIAWIIMAKTSFDIKRYKECDEYAYKAWQSDSTDLEQAENASGLLTRANIFLGNADRADYFLKKYKAIRDRRSEKSIYDSLSEMEIKYETEKKEYRIGLLEKEKQLYIWLVIVGGALLLALISVLLYRYRLRKQEVIQLKQEKQLLATQAVLDGETSERSRLARDLHDGLGGMLSVIRLNLKGVRNVSIMDGEDVGRFGKAVDMLDESITELRRVAHHMMPESLMRDGLKVSLEDYCHAIPIAHFQYLGTDLRLDSRLEVMIYRCAYELVNNAVKYAEASTINIQLMVENTIIALTVYDDGKGFDPDSITSGSGLENIRARVSAYNGKMNIRSAPGKGTEVTIEIESI